MSTDAEFDKEKETQLNSEASFSEQAEEAFKAKQWIGFVCFVDENRLKAVGPENPGFPLKAGVTTCDMPLSAAVDALYQMKQQIMSMYGLDDASLSSILENEEPMQPVKL